MSSSSMPAYAYERLIDDKGLSLDVERTGGPMGSATWRMTNSIIDIEVYSDRGRMGAAAGKHGGSAFGVGVWARLLDDSATDDMTLEQQIDFFVERLDVITRIGEREPDLEEKLRDINWIAVKNRLGLHPDAKRDAPETWTRRSV